MCLTMPLPCSRQGKYRTLLALVVLVVTVTCILYLLLDQKAITNNNSLLDYQDHAVFRSFNNPLSNGHVSFEQRHQNLDVHRHSIKDSSKSRTEKKTVEAQHGHHSSAQILLEKEARGQDVGISKIQKSSIEALARSLISCKGVPGMTLGVVKDDDHWLLPLGVRDIASGSPVTSKTKFFIGSITKTFTAQLVALMIQESEGRLSWDTQLAKIMGPDFHMATYELTKKVTLRDILSHRSGLVSGNLAVRASLPANMTRAELIRSFHLIPVNFPVSKEFLYSNMGYTLAGGVLEQWWKKSWEKLIKEKLLQPLGMHSSSVVSEAEDVTVDDFAKPYVPVEGHIKDCDPHVYKLGPIAVAGDLASSAEDMTKWIKFVLRKESVSEGGRNSGAHLLGTDLLTDMWATNIQLGPQFKARTEKRSSKGWPQEDINTGYGMGWFLNKYRGINNFWHGGGLYSYYSLVWVLPEVNMGFFISINGYKGCSDTEETPVIKPGNVYGDASYKIHGRNDDEVLRSKDTATNKCLCGSSGFGIIESLAYFITDTLLSHTPWINQTSACTYPSPWIKCGLLKGANSTVQLSTSIGNPSYSQLSNFTSYTGAYHHALLENAYVYTDNQSSALRFHLRLLTGTLILQSNDDDSTNFGLECDGRYRFLSKPDNFENTSPKQTFILKFHKHSGGEIDSLSIYYSMNETPFVFQRH